MGFFKKIFRGVKKVFKKIGKGIKKVFKGVGKFMDKIGIVGQIALMFLPLGPLLGGLLKGVGGMAAKALTAMGPIGTSILNGAKFVISKGAEFAGAVKNTFKTVTDGVATFASEFTKTSLNKMGFNPTKFGFKPGGSFDQWVQSGKGQSFGDAWGKVTANITDNASKIFDPLKNSFNATSKTTLEGLSDSTYRPIEDIKAMNPQISDWDKIDGKLINLDPDFIPNQMVPKGGWKSPVTTQDQYDAFWEKNVPNQMASNIESKAVSELGTPASLLSKYQDNSLKGSPMTVESATDFQKFMQSATPSVTDATATGGSSLLNIPSMGDAVGQVGLEVAKTAAIDAYRGEPEYSGAGGIAMDFGNAPTIQAAQPISFIDTSLRTQDAPFGYTPFNYASYMRT
tara:strand:- start:636 stop:1829 length:1194 start_codon:yes stop_codon:yes gene_type:complete